ncbi:MAG: type I glyceraldehyde-3-phosphate dehydrogenase, partial [Verrucomicrobiales bacterium]
NMNTKQEKVKLAVNGLGRIGKNALRVIIEKFDSSFDIVAANDLAPVEVIVRSLPRDSTHGKFPAEIVAFAKGIRIGRHEVTCYSETDPAKIPWKNHGVDIVLECSGFFRGSTAAGCHLTGGAGKVIISAPCGDETPMVVVGVNHHTLSADVRIVSNASCTTNCLAPVVSAIDRSFPVICGLVSTTHASTGSDRVLDAFGTRGALNNIIHGSTGAAAAIGRILPHLAGKLDGSALRVPVDTGSVLESVFQIKGTPGKEELLAAMKTNIDTINASTPLGQVAALGNLVECSRDVVGEPFSSMISDSIQIVPASKGTSLVKVTAFYDNETGYANRMVELALILGGRNTHQNADE